LRLFFKKEVLPDFTLLPRMRDRRRASRIVARQLSSLGHSSDLFLEEGMTALFEKSQGSVPRLRALLASTLFLASTEDAPAIGAELVQRAAEALEPGKAAAAAARGPLRRNAALLAGALAVCAAAAVFLIVLSHERGTPRRQPVRQPLPPPPAASAQTTPQAKIPAHASPPVAPQTAPPLKMSPFKLPPVTMPEAPVPQVVIRYTLGDPAAALRVESLGARLRGQKIDPAYSLARRGQISQPSVTYFFAEDADLARRIAAVAGGDLVTSLQMPLEGTNLRQPGTIEIEIP
jgi:hypothetical protein